MSRSKYKQNIFDIASENFGSLENLIRIVKDNNISISDEIVSDTEIIIKEGVGNETIKGAIFNKEISMNNFFEPEVSDGIGAWIIEDTFIIQ